MPAEIATCERMLIKTNGNLSHRYCGRPAAGKPAPSPEAEGVFSLFSEEPHWAVTVIACAALFPAASYAMAWILCDAPGFAGTFQG